MRKRCEECLKSKREFAVFNLLFSLCLHVRESNPCRNSGTCVDQAGSYSCQCVNGYTDHMCDVDIDDCQGVTCQVNNTHCIDVSTLIAVSVNLDFMVLNMV